MAFVLLIETHLCFGKKLLVLQQRGMSAMATAEEKQYFYYGNSVATEDWGSLCVEQGALSFLRWKHLVTIGAANLPIIILKGRDVQLEPHNHVPRQRLAYATSA